MSGLFQSTGGPGDQSPRRSWPSSVPKDCSERPFRRTIHQSVYQRAGPCTSTCRRGRPRAFSALVRSAALLLLDVASQLETELVRRPVVNSFATLLQQQASRSAVQTQQTLVQLSPGAVHFVQNTRSCITSRLQKAG